GDRLVVPVVSARDLRGDDELVPRDAAGAHGLADLGFVAVVHGGVHDAVAGLDRRHDGRDPVVAGEPVGAEADFREPVAVGQSERGDVDRHRVFLPLRIPSTLTAMRTQRTALRMRYPTEPTAAAAGRVSTHASAMGFMRRQFAALFTSPTPST